MPVEEKVKESQCITMGVVTYPTLEKGVIHKYRKFKYESRFYVKCDKKVTNENGILCSCSMELEREDNLKDGLLIISMYINQESRLH